MCTRHANTNHKLSLLFHPHTRIILKRECLSTGTLTLFKCTLTCIEPLRNYGSLNGTPFFLEMRKTNKQTWKCVYLMHALQAIIANFEPFDDLHLNLHELNILNLLADISRVFRTTGKKKKSISFANIFRWQNIQGVMQ